MGTALLIALLVLPLVGALVVAFLKNDDRIAKVTALAVTLVEFVLAVLLWISYVPAATASSSPRRWTGSGSWACTCRSAWTASRW